MPAVNERYFSLIQIFILCQYIRARTIFQMVSSLLAVAIKLLWNGQNCTTFTEPLPPTILVTAVPFMIYRKNYLAHIDDGCTLVTRAGAEIICVKRAPIHAVNIVIVDIRQLFRKYVKRCYFS